MLLRVGIESGCTFQFTLLYYIPPVSSSELIDQLTNGMSARFQANRVRVASTIGWKNIGSQTVIFCDEDDGIRELRSDEGTEDSGSEAKEGE